MISNQGVTLNTVINQLNELNISKKELRHLVKTALKNETKTLYFDICYDLINERFHYAITTDNSVPNFDSNKYNYLFVMAFESAKSYLKYINLFDKETFSRELFNNLIINYEMHLKVVQETIFKALELNDGEAINNPIINDFIKNNEILATDYYVSLDDYKQKTKNFSLFA